MEAKDKIGDILDLYKAGEKSRDDAIQLIIYRIAEYALIENGGFLEWLHSHKVGKIDKYGKLYLIYDGSIQALVEKSLGM